MFRYAYSGHGPRFAWSFETPRENWRSSGRYCSWHSGPLLGVRRPIRYLAYRLDLDDRQLRELAEILDHLKTARAQADVDWRRSASDLAGSLESGDFDETRASAAFDLRSRSGEQLRAQTLDCLRRLHRLLDPDQRRELAYLMRSGGLSF
jgi:Spy/CpxP family protein refolding chaperone